MPHSFLSWIIFLGIVITLMILDLGVLNPKDQEISIKKSLCLSGFYIGIAVLFGFWIYAQGGLQKASEYYTGYFLEKSLSLDNLFVISLIFSYFAIPRKYQHRVLFWGILGVIIFRAVMIGMGAVLIAKFSWMLYVFGGFLVLLGFKMLFLKETKTSISDNRLLKFLKKYLNITADLHGNRFFIKDPVTKIRYITPLLTALILIESADIIFALDSIPAIFVITTDPYIVYTSNIFAILGLRSLYFALDALLARFIYLQQAISLVLIFIGSKVFVAHLLGWEKFPPLVSLGVTIGLLSAGMGFSLWKTKNGHPPPIR